MEMFISSIHKFVWLIIPAGYHLLIIFSFFFSVVLFRSVVLFFYLTLMFELPIT